VTQNTREFSRISGLRIEGRAPSAETCPPRQVRVVERTLSVIGVPGRPQQIGHGSAVNSVWATAKGRQETAIGSARPVPHRQRALTSVRSPTGCGHGGWTISSRTVTRSTPCRTATPEPPAPAQLVANAAFETFSY